MGIHLIPMPVLLAAMLAAFQTFKSLSVSEPELGGRDAKVKKGDNENYERGLFICDKLFIPLFHSMGYLVYTESCKLSSKDK